MNISIYNRNSVRFVEQGVVFYLISPSHVSIPRKNQNGTMAKDALLMEKFISAERARAR